MIDNHVWQTSKKLYGTFYTCFIQYGLSRKYSRYRTISVKCTYESTEDITNALNLEKEFIFFFPIFYQSLTDICLQYCTRIGHTILLTL